MINKFKSISFDTRGLGKTSLLSCEIETEGRPIKQRYYNIAPAKLKLLEAELDNMLKLGVVEPSNGSWSNPIVTVQKKDGTVRFCLDSRKLNKVTKKDSYPLPYINFIFDNLKGARYISSIDLSKAFWQIPLVNSSKEKTAFVDYFNLRFCHLDYATQLKICSGSQTNYSALNSAARFSVT